MGKLKFYVVSLLALVLSFAAVPALADDDEETTTYSYSELTTLLSSFEDYTFDDSALGCYSVEGYTASEINSALTTAQALTSESETDDITASYTTLNAILTVGFEINVPAEGSFLRISSYLLKYNGTGTYYLSSNVSESDANRADFITDGTGAETIFYYDGSLLSFAKGYYPTSYLSSNAGIVFDAIQTDDPVEVGFVQFVANDNNGGTAPGVYGVCFIPSSSGTFGYTYMLSCDANHYAQSMTTRYGGRWLGFYLEEVTTLPYTTNSAGYATIYSPVALTIPDGITAVYTAEISDADELTYTLTEIEDLTVIPQETPVVVKGEASTTYSFTITDDVDESTIESSMGGQIATVLSTGVEYVIDDTAEELAFTLTTSDETELQGFTSYAVLDPDLATVEDVQTALDQFTSTYTIGTTLGTYSVTIDEVTVGETTYTDYATLAAAAEELISSEDASASDYAAMVTALNSAYSSASYTLNLPEEGTFLRIRSANTGGTYYLSSTSVNTYSSTARIDFVTSCTGDNEAGTIFYWDGTYLINYETGYYVTYSGNFVYYDGVTSSPTTVSFVAHSAATTGAYAVKYLTSAGSTYMLYCRPAYLTADGGSYSSTRTDINYSFYLEEVETLPVTTDEAGYATLYAPVALTVPDGVTLYTAAFDEESGEETKTEVEDALSVLAAKTPIVIKGTESTTYDFTISSEDGTTIESSLVGVLAAITSTGAEAVLTYDETEATSAFTDTESGAVIPGFSAYLESFSINWSGLAAAISALSNLSDELGYYNVDTDVATTDEVAETLETAEATYAKYGTDEEDDVTYAEVAELIEKLTEYADNLELNLPDAGTFLRISNVYNSGYYLGWENCTGSGYTSRAAFVNGCADDNELGTIFYYDGSYLVNYKTGYYVATSSNMLTYSGITAGTVVSFAENVTGTETTPASYSVNYASNGRTLYCYDRTISGTKYYYADGAGYGVSSTDTRYDFYLTEVTSLPVVVGESGVATFSAPVAVTIPDGITVYTVAYADGEFTETAYEGTTLPAGSAVLVKGDEGEYYFEIAESEEEAPEGSLVATTPTIAGSETTYTLQTVGYEPFYAVETDEVQGFTAYLTIESDGEDYYALNGENTTYTETLEGGTSYYLVTEDGYYYADEDGLSIKTALDKTDANYRFMVVALDAVEAASASLAGTTSTNAGNYLIYSVGQGTFFAAEFTTDNSAVASYEVSETEEVFYIYLASDGSNESDNIALLKTSEDDETPAVYTVEIGTIGWSTLALPVATVIQSGVTAYTATEVTTSLVRFDEITDEVLGAKEGVVVYADGGGTFYFPESSETGSTGSIMTGVVDEGGYTFTTAGEAYVLRAATDDDNSSLGVVFSLVTEGETLGQYKAYVTAPTSGESISFVFGSEDIEGITGVETAAEATGTYYDLQGRAVKNPVKGGIYIVDGKKVII